jgi:hypothetical protein
VERARPRAPRGRSSRCQERRCLAWETELLQHLDREGLTVPVPIPTMDGRLFADGLVVMTYVEGGQPETEADWRQVADTLRRLHRRSAQAGDRRPSSCTPRPRRGSTSARCRPRALLDAEQRGRGSSDVTHASSTAIPTTLVTSCMNPKSGRADRLGRVARPRPRPGAAERKRSRAAMVIPKPKRLKYHMRVCGLIAFCARCAPLIIPLQDSRLC